MVYKATDEARVQGEPGYAIYAPNQAYDGDLKFMWEIYTDDGAGNGDFVARASEKYWAERIAYALDALDAE